jgi:hypothetical protein
MELMLTGDHALQGDNYLYSGVEAKRKDPKIPFAMVLTAPVLSKIQGPFERSIPPFIGLAPKMGHMEWADNGAPGSGAPVTIVTRTGRGSRSPAMIIAWQTRKRCVRSWSA